MNGEKEYEYEIIYSIKDLPRSEIEDRLRFYQNELDQKDKLIRELTKSTTHVSPNHITKHVDIINYSSDKLDEIKAKVEKLQNNIAENKEIITEKNMKICELKANFDKLSLENLEQLKHIEELEEDLREKTQKLFSYEQAENQHELVMQSLQEDLKFKTAKLLDLRSQNKISEQKHEEKVYNLRLEIDEMKKFFTDQANLLDCDKTAQSCILKVTELLRSVTDMKQQIHQQNDIIETCEFEQKASRETILRLSGEINKEQLNRENVEKSERELKQELEKVITAKEICDSKIKYLEERVQHLTNTLQIARSDAIEHQKQLNKITEAELIFDIKNDHKTNKNQLNCEECEWDSEKITQTDQLINYLSIWLNCTKETNINTLHNLLKNRLEDMETTLNNQMQVITELENKLVEYNHDKTRNDTNINHLKERIDYLEKRRASDGTLIDSLRSERDNLHDHLNKLAQIIKLDEPISELGIEILTETLKVRLTQLQNNDTEKQTAQRIRITNLQKELRVTKDRAESLELQIGLLRRRLAEAQENRYQTNIPASQTPLTLATSEKERRKLAKQIEQLKEEDEKLREEIVLLKARLLESSQTQLANISNSKTLRTAKLRIDELEKLCKNQTEEIKKLTNKLEHNVKNNLIEKNELKQDLIHKENEIKHLQIALQTSQKSEEQLLEFRTMVARYLGLDSELLTMPDYEILTLLDRLVSANQTHIANAVATERALDLVSGNIKPSRNT